MNGEKSLGTITLPQFDFESFNGRTGEAIIRVSGDRKFIKLKLSTWQVKKMIEISNKIINEQRKFAQSEFDFYQRLRNQMQYKEEQQ